jgi:hypothetical protein
MSEQENSCLIREIKLYPTKKQKKKLILILLNQRQFLIQR